MNIGDDLMSTLMQENDNLSVIFLRKCKPHPPQAVPLPLLRKGKAKRKGKNLIHRKRVSLRLGHLAALDCPRQSIHYRSAASLPFPFSGRGRQSALLKRSFHSDMIPLLLTLVISLVNFRGIILLCHTDIR